MFSLFCKLESKQMVNEYRITQIKELLRQEISRQTLKRTLDKRYLYLGGKIQQLELYLFLMIKYRKMIPLTNRSEKKTFGKYLTEMYVLLS
jgi:hypothetical protein